jgi:hypothetical protein
VRKGSKGGGGSEARSPRRGSEAWLWRLNRVREPGDAAGVLLNKLLLTAADSPSSLITAATATRVH